MGYPEHLENEMDIRALFDSAAQDYDGTRLQYIPCFEQLYGTVLELIPNHRQEPLRILDLGAGTGLLSGLIVKAFPEALVTLADVSTGMLEKARERFDTNPNVSYRVLDFVNAQLAGHYDVVVSALALHHTPQERLKEVFQKVFNVFEDGGVFINADQTLGTTPQNEQRYADAWLAGARARGCTGEDIEIAMERMKADRTATLEKQLAWMREAGFSHVDCWYKHYRFAVYSGEKMIPSIAS